MLPPATRVYPAHDYHGNTVSTIGWEKRHNARLAGRERGAFITLMAELHLPRPKMIDVAVPANQHLGIPMPSDDAKPTARHHQSRGSAGEGGGRADGGIADARRDMGIVQARRDRAGRYADAGRARSHRLCAGQPAYRVVRLSGEKPNDHFLDDLRKKVEARPSRSRSCAAAACARITRRRSRPPTGIARRSTFSKGSRATRARTASAGSMGGRWLDCLAAGLARDQIAGAALRAAQIWSRSVSTKGFGRPRAFRVEKARSAPIAVGFAEAQ